LKLMEPSRWPLAEISADEEPPQFVVGGRAIDSWRHALAPPLNRVQRDQEAVY
jgi:hypothetical protein